MLKHNDECLALDATTRDATPTTPPPAEAIDLASMSLDTAAMSLLNTADQCSASCELEQALINVLEDHGHGLLRAAAALRGKRLRRQHKQG